MIDELQLEALLAGHAKLLDCKRKGVLKLPASAFKVWHCHWMHENCADESYLSVARVMEETDLSRNTVEHWRAFLIKAGWMARTGEVVQPRNGGRFAVYVTTVKDGAKPQSLVVTPKTGGDPKSTAPQILGSEGSSSSSGSGSDSGSHLGSNLLHLRPPAGGGGSATGKPTEKNLKPQTKNRKPKAAKDGTPWPKDFNAWTNDKRLVWLDQHDPENLAYRAPAKGVGGANKPQNQTALGQCNGSSDHYCTNAAAIRWNGQAYCSECFNAGKKAEGA